MTRHPLHHQVKTMAEAVSAVRQITIKIMDAGRVEAGTSESALLISVLNFLQTQPGGKS